LLIFSIFLFPFPPPPPPPPCLRVDERVGLVTQAKDLAEAVMQGIFEWNVKNDVVDAERPT